MPEKDLFELTIKRGLENWEAPMPADAWSELQAKMKESQTPLVPLAGAGGAATSSGVQAGASFLRQFGIAAAFLAGSLALLTQWGGDESTHITDHNHVAQSSANDSLAEHGDSEMSTVEQSTNLIEQEDANDDSSQALTELSQDSEKHLEVIDEIDLSDSSISESEAMKMLSINERLQEMAAEKQEEEPVQRHTTRYLGEGFDLGAKKSFSPDNDGRNDVFLPSELKDGDQFVMTVSSLEGHEIFKTTDVSSPWNGTDSTGNNLDEGRYRWEVIVQKDNKKKIFKGVVELER